MMMKRRGMSPPRIIWGDVFSLLFCNLDASNLNTHPSTGRKPFACQSFLQAVIFENFKGIPSLAELVAELKKNVPRAIRCSMDILKPLLIVEKFSVREIDFQSHIHGSGWVLEKKMLTHHT